MKYTKLFEELKSITKSIKLNEPMKNHTTFKIGGPADIFLEPLNSNELSEILKLCNKYDIKPTIMGNGSNLLVKDNGIRGIVIKISNNFSNYVIKGDTIEAEAGILLSKLSNVALQNSLTGLEFSAGIPGTLGGAIAMNAGAYGGELKDVVDSTEYIDMCGNIGIIEREQHKFAYRTSAIQQSDFIVLKSKLRLAIGEKEKIKLSIDTLTAKRREKQPLNMPSAGSVFKRPEGHYVGKLIEDCGLKGYMIGGAMVSTLHTGFIVNEGNATAEDVLSLIQYIQKNVKDKFNVQLEPEVKIIGY